MASASALSKLLRNMDKSQDARPVPESGISPLGVGVHLAFSSVTVLAVCSRVLDLRIQFGTDLLWLGFALALWFLANARNLPVQNRLLALILASGLGWGVLSALTAAGQPSPFQCYWPSANGSLLGGTAQPLLWAALLLHGRGVAKLLLNQPSRSPWHGLQLMTLASLLVCAFTVGPALAQGTIRSTRWPQALAVVAGWFALAVLCEALLTPALLKKRPGPEIHFTTSVWVWIAVNCLVITSALGAGHWKIAVLQGLLTLFAVGLPLQRFGARRNALIMADPT